MKDSITVRRLAADLAFGAQAEIVGGGYLYGTSPRYVEVDGVPVALTTHRRKEAIGVRTVQPDGYTSLYLTPTRERAQALLGRAEELLRIA